SKTLLVGDIGGTNSNFGVFTLHEDQHKLLVSLHFKSHEIVNFTALVKQVLDYVKSTYNFHIQAACVAGAGVVSAKRDYIKPTNLNFSIDSKDIIKNTDLKCVVLTNDFEVIGYGLALIDPKALVLINQ